MSAALVLASADGPAPPPAPPPDTPPLPPPPFAMASPRCAACTASDRSNAAGSQGFQPLVEVVALLLGDAVPHGLDEHVEEAVAVLAGEGGDGRADEEEDEQHEEGLHGVCST